MGAGEGLLPPPEIWPGGRTMVLDEPRPTQSGTALLAAAAGISSARSSGEGVDYCIRVGSIMLAR